MDNFKQWKDFLLPYKFALDELQTKINIIAEEAKFMNDYNPMEHIKTRLKTPQSIMQKLKRKNIEPTLKNAKLKLFDIAGLRIVCPFTTDIYIIHHQLLKRTDINVVEVKDYIRFPKPNGYQSLHMIIKVPITLSTGVEHVYAEIQLRTLAMDFWASIEHKIFYKYGKAIPAYLEKELKEAAHTANLMDIKMKRIHEEVKLMKQENDDEVYLYLQQP